MSKVRTRLGLLLLLIFTILFSVNVPADLGDFNDYDSDSGWGDSDWGNDDSDWDWGDDDDDDDDYNYSYHSSGSSGGSHRSGGGAGDMVLAVIIFIIIMAVVMASRNGKKGSGNVNTQQGSGEIKDNTAEIVPEIVKIDPNFSDTRFMSWAKEVFITLQMAWSKRDMTATRPFEKEELFRQHQLQLKSYIDNGRINVIDRINVNNAHFFEYKRDNQYEYLTVFMKCRMIDYIKDEKTGQVLKGDPNKDCYPRYLLTFMRKNGVKTDAAVSNKSTTNCPNCGAPCQVTSSGQCEYCGSVITTGEFDWVLSDIQGVKRNSNYGSGGVSITETPKEGPQAATPESLINNSSNANNTGDENNNNNGF